MARYKGPATARMGRNLLETLRMILFRLWPDGY
jgi:hypothetical protein